MNLNIIAYGTYFIVMAFIIGRVGWLFYHHGQVFVDRLFPEDLSYGAWLNKLLLKGYYLFNLGYVAISIGNWKTITTVHALIEKLAEQVGTIVLMLALMHYMNLIWLQLYSNWKHKQVNSLTTKSSNHGSE